MHYLRQKLITINLQWKKRNMELVAQPYKRLGWKKTIASVGQLIELYRVIKKNKIVAIHPFCTPAGGIGYLLSKISGAVLVMDSYEPHATAMVETGVWKKIVFHLNYFLNSRKD